MKVKIIRNVTFLCAVLGIVLEALPQGVVLRFSDGVAATETLYSYFSFTPFGFALFAALLTAIATCVVCALDFALLFTDNRTLCGATGALALLAAALPLSVLVSSPTVVSGFVFACLSLHAALAIFFSGKTVPSAERKAA